jgi:hypothetical protein
MTAHERKAARLGIKPPGPATLRRYGITADEWLGLLAAQGWRCAVCHKTGATVRWNTDHDHVPGWKNKTADERRRYVRGVLCVFCNFRRVNSRMPAIEARRIAAYLEAYEARRDS